MAPRTWSNYYFYTLASFSMFFSIGVRDILSFVLPVPVRSHALAKEYVNLANDIRRIEVSRRISYIFMPDYLRSVQTRVGRCNIQ